MSSNRAISPDFWTCAAIIDRAPMTRLLFLGLWNFADPYSVQLLRPRTMRMQVFPGDDIDGDRVRAMIEERATRKLVRIYGGSETRCASSPDHVKPWQSMGHPTVDSAGKQGAGMSLASCSRRNGRMHDVAEGMANAR